MDQPFRGAFPDFTMEIVTLIEEGDRVVACTFAARAPTSANGSESPATGRRFERVDEIYVFQVVNGKLAGALGVEDNLARMKQLGIGLTAPTEQATDP